MQAVAAVFPFRVSTYVVEELIDWSDIPDDPIFQLTFPQPGMLEDAHFDRMYRLIRSNAAAAEVRAAAHEIQATLNPHPGGQLALNVPRLHGHAVRGVQHKYAETALFFPAAGQTCHTYCTYCFRWAQFVGNEDLRFAARESQALVRYLKVHPEIRSVLITGGDPMVMKSSVLKKYVEPLLDPSLDHLESIRFGTKAPAYWPFRFTSAPDAEDLLRLFRRIRRSGRHVALMAHYSHPRELETPAAQEAVRRIQETGAVVRCQAPLIRHVNDSAQVWRDLWQNQTRLGAVPYYMFVERDTGPRHYFEVPLARSLQIFQEAYRNISGLARTVRGPSMSATPGKVLVDGRTRIHGEEVFALMFLQARNPEWVGRPFFARYDPNAVWLDDLRPAFGERRFFFESGTRPGDRLFQLP
jgi:KamA family protein